MFRIIPMTPAFLGVLVAQVCLAQPVATTDAARLLAGVWRVIPGGMYTEDAGGKRFYPFGQDVVARFVLTSDGFGANSLQNAERANCMNGSGPRQCSAAEAEAAFQTASSYQYRYRLEPDADNPLKGKMIWEVDLSVYPNWRGQTLIRRYDIKPDGTGWTLLAPLPSNPQMPLQVYLERER
jgi:hypothetical protein